MQAPPKRILMLKGHSAGIGDILRSSAAWRVLKNAYPDAELHLLLFTREPGYPSEELIREHHLLSSFAVVDKRTGNREEKRRFWADIRAIADRVKPDMVIDFERDGLRTSLVTAWFSWFRGARTVGINTRLGRRFFYGRASVSPRKFAAQRGLTWPMEYTDRDFVVLSALGLERNDCPIDLNETAAGRTARLELRKKYNLGETTPLLGLNIGCGTSDARSKRPNLTTLSDLVAGIQRDHKMPLVLVGAPFERDINREFCALHREKTTEPIVDLAGETSISGLTGVINSCALFISSDSGPFHIGVAMRVPTLVVFNWNNSTHFHRHPWVRCCVIPPNDPVPSLRAAAEELLATGQADRKIKS